MATVADEVMSDKSRSDRERFPELFRDGPCIDRSKCTRTTPMKVLCFGLPRSGTASMRTALTTLGFSHVHHMVDVFYNSDDAQWFMRANEAKHRNKGTFTKEDWDKLLGDCQACIDIPAAFFSHELIAAYPDAKVIVMERDYDKWYTSMSNTVFKTRSPNLFGYFVLWLDYKYTGQAAYMAQSIMNDFLGPEGTDYESLKQRYNHYFGSIRKSVPKERLLEFQLKDGYEPLAEFLEVPVPKEIFGEKEITKPFPRINETSIYDDRIRVLYRETIKRLATKYIAPPVGLGALALGAWTLLAKFHQ